MKIGVIGCSHTSKAYGLSWVDYLKERYDADILDASASGVGNEMYIEKIKHILEKEDVNFLIVQLTEPSRLVMGIYGNDRQEESRKYNLPYVEKNNLVSHRYFKDADYFTFTVRDSGQELYRVLTNVDYTMINNFFTKHILLSEYNLNLKVFHTMLTIQSLCEFYGKKILFFSWFVDIHKLAEKSGYSDVIKNFNVINGCIEDFTNSIKLKRMAHDNYHYGSDSQKIIFDDFLEKHIDYFIKNNI